MYIYIYVYIHTYNYTYTHTSEGRGGLRHDADRGDADAALVGVASGGYGQFS